MWYSTKPTTHPHDNNNSQQQRFYTFHNNTIPTNAPPVNTNQANGHGVLGHNSSHNGDIFYKHYPYQEQQINTTPIQDQGPMKTIKKSQRRYSSEDRSRKQSELPIKVKKDELLIFFLRLARKGEYWCSGCRFAQLLALTITLTIEGKFNTHTWKTIPYEFELANEKQKVAAELEEHDLVVETEETKTSEAKIGQSTRRNRYMRISISGVPPGEYYLHSNIKCIIDAVCQKCSGNLNIEVSMKEKIANSRRNFGANDNCTSKYNRSEQNSPSTDLLDDIQNEIDSIFGDSDIISKETFINNWKDSNMAVEGNAIQSLNSPEISYVGCADLSAEDLYERIIRAGFEKDNTISKNNFQIYYPALRPFSHGIIQFLELQDVLTNHYLGISYSNEMIKLVCQKSNTAVLIKNLQNGEYAMVKNIHSNPKNVSYDVPHSSLKLLVQNYLRDDVCCRCREIN